MLARWLVIVLLAPLFLAPLAARGAPPWVQQLAAEEIPGEWASEDAVVLLDEQRTEVRADGREHSTLRFAVKILKNDGSRYAVARAVYWVDSGKVKSLRAWLIDPERRQREYGKKDVLDVSLADNDVYQEVRAKAIVASGEAGPGSLFAFEAIREDRSVFTQDQWLFQNRLPVRLSRFGLTLPDGWEAESITFNYPEIEPEVTGQTRTWELRRLAPIPWEPYSPSATSLAPRLAVRWFPPAGTPAPTVSFRDWKDVSQWLSRRNDPQAEPDTAVRAKALELVGDLQDEWARIAALARYVQGVNYVSIQTDLGRGGGYVAHTASQVLDKFYGDCKDKATLMRALLRSLGIRSYFVGIHSGDPDFVRAEWPALQQFNHAVVAVAVGPEVQASSLVDDPELGRLLLFDPTDPLTPLGRLPATLQGSLALVAAGASGRLLRMPETEPEDHHVQRDVEAALSAQGTLTARLTEQSVGQAAVQENALYSRHGTGEYRELIQRWIARSAAGAEISSVSPAYLDEHEQFRLDAAFEASGYAQVAQGRLMILRPTVLEARRGTAFTDEERVHPIQLGATSFEERITIRLPEGFLVDELPEAVELEESFGAYRGGCRVEPGQLVCVRSLRLERACLERDSYPQVRAFFTAIAASEQAPAVLLRH